MVSQKRQITLGTLQIRDRGKQYVNDCLNKNRLSRGSYTDHFESGFAKLHGCKYGLFMNSGTSALQVALAALKEVHGWADGDEILVPATTFIATSNVVLMNNLTPVFVDVDSKTYNLDPNKIEEEITSKTRAIIPVHLFGLPASMKWIQAIAGLHDLKIIEDSCETVGATLDGKPVGSFGDFACFSFYVAHHVVGGVGGMVTTNDDHLNEVCKSLMQHGRDSIYTTIDDDNNADDALLKAMISRRYSFDRVGYSYRATELEAALALAELECLQSNLSKRQDNAYYLISLLQDLKNVLQLPIIPVGFEHSFMMFPFLVDESVNRDEFLLFLEKHQIETRLLFPLLETPIYKKLFPGLESQYPVAQKLAKQGAFIGMHQGLTTEDIEYVSEVIHDYFRKSK